MADVDVKFSADLENIKTSLAGLKTHFETWAKDIKVIGVAAFAFTAAKDAIAAFIQVIKSGLSVVRDWVNEAQKSELINVRLGIAVRNAGDGVGFTSDELIKYAESLSAVTVFSTDEIKATERKLITMGVYANKLKELIVLSTAVASVEDRNLQSTAVAINRAMGALADPKAKAGVVRRMLAGAGVFLSPAELAEIQASSDKQQALMDVLAKRYKGAAEEIANSGWGVSQMLSNLYSDIKANLGQGFLDILKSLKEPLTIILEHVRELTGEFAEWFKTITASAGVTGTIATLQEFVLRFFAKIEEFMSRIPTFFKMIKAGLLEIHVAILEMVASLPKLVFGDAPAKAEAALRNRDPLSEEQKKKRDPLVKEYLAADNAYKEVGGVLNILKGGLTEEAKATRQAAAARVDAAKEALKKFDDANITPGGAIITRDKAIAEAKAAVEAEGDFASDSDKRYLEIIARSEVRKGMALFNTTKDYVEKQAGPAFKAIKDWWDKGMNPPDTRPDAAGDSNTAAIGQMMNFGINKIFDNTMLGLAQADRVKNFVPIKESKSAIEDAKSVFARIQTSAASVEVSPELKAQQDILGKLKEKVDQDKAEADDRKAAWKHLKTMKPLLAP